MVRKCKRSLGVTEGIKGRKERKRDNQDSGKNTVWKLQLQYQAVL